MCTKIINDQLTDLFYNFIEMEDRIAANDRYADLNSSDMRFLSAVGKGVLGYDCLIDCSQIPMIYCNYETQDICHDCRLYGPDRLREALQRIPF